MTSAAPIPITLVQISARAPALSSPWPPVAVTRLLQLQRDRHFFLFVFKQPWSSLFLPLSSFCLNSCAFGQFASVRSAQSGFVTPGFCKASSRLRAVLSPRSTVLASPCSSFLQPPYTHSATACEGHQHGCSRPSPPHPLQPGHRQGMITPPKLSTLTSVKGTNKTPPRPASCRVFAGRLVELLRVSSRG